MDPDTINELRNRLASIEGELRVVREVLERYAPPPAPKRETTARSSLDDLIIQGDDLTAFLIDPALSSLPEAVDRFLGLLGFLYQRHGEKFDRVEEIRGRKRIYFSKSKHEIAASGRATMPRSIPTSPWFVVSNNSTRGKVDLLTQACRLLGHSEMECIAVARVIDPEAAVNLELRIQPHHPEEEDDEDPFQI
jgi:negative regulator of replication initiation